MSGKIIYLDDPSSADQVVAALQQALDEVLNPGAVNWLRGYAYGCHNYQHVHPRNGRPAVATVSLIKSSKDDPEWALFIHIFYGQNRPTFIPNAIVRRLRIGLRGTTHGGKFVDVPLNQEFEFYMALPREVFIQNPNGVVILA